MTKQFCYQVYLTGLKNYPEIMGIQQNKLYYFLIDVCKKMNKPPRKNLFHVPL